MIIWQANYRASSSGAQHQIDAAIEQRLGTLQFCIETGVPLI